MPEFFLELFSEEIPARMQARAADDLARLVGEALAGLKPAGIRTFYGPRRIALAAEVGEGVAAQRISERGPRRTAPEQAIAGFLRKFGAAREELREEGDFWVLERETPGTSAATLIAGALPGLLRRFPWPKSMRWGGTSQFTWVRPLRRIVCLLDGAVVKFDLRDADDDGHGLESGDVTEGHRFLSPGEITVSSCADWQAKLRAAHVLVEADERRQLIADGIAALAAERQLSVVDDPGLLDEVAGLVEWPVPLLGRIDAAFMDLPPEVMQVSMRVNQRYFALRDAAGRAAPYFAFAANVVAPDGCTMIVAGNERVLRARFSDARHFWDLDRKTALAARVGGLDAITFHAKLGSQGSRVKRIIKLAETISSFLGADPVQVSRAAELCKADLTSGMVAEFPELQGIMGGYYAAYDGEAPEVANAVREHYQPKGQGDVVPVHPVAISVALADKLDTLAVFFAIGERPTGSGDPYALRRAALGVIRICRESGIRVPLESILVDHVFTCDRTLPIADILVFILERLRVQLRAEGARHDVLNAVLEAGADDDIVRILARTEAVAAFLATEDGANLLAAYRRAANILRIEEKKDGVAYTGDIDAALLEAPEEQTLAAAIAETTPRVAAAIAAETFAEAMSALATLRSPIDAFFTAIQVNAARPELRRNRLQLLAAIRAAMNLAADFARIEG